MVLTYRKATEGGLLCLDKRRESGTFAPLAIHDNLIKITSSLWGLSPERKSVAAGRIYGFYNCDNGSPECG